MGPTAVNRERPRRPPELQDALNRYLYHPLAWQIARGLARTPVTPNMVSIAGGLLVVAAAFAYSLPGWPGPALLGLALHMGWHVLDGADGDLARLTGRSGPAGELIDGIADYSSHIVLYAVLALILQTATGPAIAWLSALAAGVSHIVQSNHFEVQRRQYLWWVYGVPWLGNYAASPSTRPRGIIAFADAYLKLASRLSNQPARIEAAIAAVSNDPVKLAQARETVRHHGPSFLPRAQLLSNNHRTLALGVAMLLGSPLAYFLYEIVVLNLVLAVSTRRSNAAMAQIALELERTPAEITAR
ncbi:CDP-alcohol phosphatidyltransferase family protein [Altererythrobacter fulvus]|uniref:CDP-alcohol phosphatidyltransferase family protein n=1 Tax=Caenibius fulvus TaxID=2126012 RepID=UPI003015AB9B